MDIKTEMCEITTSLAEVNGVEFRVMKVLCRQVNTDPTRFLGMANPSVNDSSYRGRYKLKFPFEWDINKDIHVAVESCSITGIPTFDAMFVEGINNYRAAQLPICFSIRSDALGNSGSVMEAKRYRGQITGVNTTTGIGVQADAIPYSSTEFYGQDSPATMFPVTTFGLVDSEEIPTYKSNILQIVPNPFQLNFKHDQTSVGAGFYFSTMYYQVHWKQPVKLGSSGTRISANFSQDVFDLYLTCNYDIQKAPQNTWQYGGQDERYYNVPVGGEAAYGEFYPKLMLATSPDTEVFGARNHRPTWQVMLVFYQLAK